VKSSVINHPTCKAKGSFEQSAHMQAGQI